MRSTNLGTFGHMVNLVFVAPGLWMISYNPHLHPTSRSFLRATAATTLLFEGWMLLKDLDSR